MQTNYNEGDTGRINMPNPIIKTKKQIEKMSGMIPGLR